MILEWLKVTFSVVSALNIQQVTIQNNIKLLLVMFVIISDYFCLFWMSTKFQGSKTHSCSFRGYNRGDSCDFWGPLTRLSLLCSMIINLQSSQSWFAYQYIFLCKIDQCSLNCLILEKMQVSVLLNVIHCNRYNNSISFSSLQKPVNSTTFSVKTLRDWSMFRLLL